MGLAFPRHKFQGQGTQGSGLTITPTGDNTIGKNTNRRSAGTICSSAGALSNKQICKNRARSPGPHYFKGTRAKGRPPGGEGLTVQRSTASRGLAVREGPQLRARQRSRHLSPPSRASRTPRPPASPKPRGGTPAATPAQRAAREGDVRAAKARRVDATTAGAPRPAPPGSGRRLTFPSLWKGRPSSSGVSAGRAHGGSSAGTAAAAS